MMETFKYKSIQEEYGINVLQQIRELEDVCRTKGRYASHLHFYLQCKRKELTPKGIKIKSQMKGAEARQIIEKAERGHIYSQIETNTECRRRTIPTYAYVRQTDTI